MSGGVIGPEYDGQIRQAIRKTQNRNSTEMVAPGKSRIPSRFPPHAVLLTEDVEGDTLTPGFATATLLRWSDGEYVETPDTIQVALHAGQRVDGDFGFVVFVDGAYRLLDSGGGGGGGGSSCSCLCVSPDMIHPAGFETLRNWTVPLKSNIPFAETDDASGQVSVPAGSYAISWDAAESKWVGQFDSQLIVQNLDGTGGTASSQSLRVEMEWTGVGTRMPVRFIYDAVGVA